MRTDRFLSPSLVQIMVKNIFQILNQKNTYLFSLLFQKLKLRQDNITHMKNQQPNSLPINPNAPTDNSTMFPTISASSHPVLSLLHIILKACIVAVYLLFPFFFPKTQIWQFIIIAAAIDFWIVKNIVGRLLVGLRWWIDFDENGEQMWKFQCKVDEKNVNPADYKVFWWTLYLFSLIWIALTVINVLKLDITQIVMCVFCGGLIVFNLVSYYKCSKVQEENVQKLAYQYGADVAGKFMTGSIIANYF